MAHRKSSHKKLTVAGAHLGMKHTHMKKSRKRSRAKRA